MQYNLTFLTIWIVTAGLSTVSMHSLSAMEQATTLKIKFEDGRSIPNVPRSIVRLCETFKDQLDDTDRSINVDSVSGGKLSYAGTNAFIELLKRAVPKELQTDSYEDLNGTQLQQIQDNILMHLNDRLSLHNTGEFQAAMTIITAADCLNFSAIQKAVYMAVTQYLISTRNAPAFVQRPAYYASILNLLEDSTDAVRYGITDALMQSSKDLYTFYCQCTLQDHTKSVSPIAFSPDGRHLAAGTWNGTINIWNTHIEAENLLRTLSGHEGWVLAVAYHPDGQQLASGGADGTTKLWNLRTDARSPIRTFANTTPRWVCPVIFSPDGMNLAVGSGDGTIIMRNLHAEAETPVIYSMGHIGSISCIAFHPDGKQFAAGSSNHTIKIWDLAMGICIRTLEDPDLSNLRTIGHNSYAIAFNHDGTQLASAANSSALRIWDPRTGAITRTLKTIWPAPGAVAYNHDSTQLAFASSKRNSVAIWDLPTDHPNPLTELTGHTQTISSVAFSPDGKQLASSSCDESIKIWKRKPRRFTELLSLSQLAQFLLLKNNAGSVAAASLRAAYVDLQRTVARDLPEEEAEEFIDALAHL